MVQWRVWHACRRGLGSNLHELGVPDLTIQGLPCHNHVATMGRSYVKIREDDVTAGMRLLQQKFEERKVAQPAGEKQTAKQVNGCGCQRPVSLSHPLN